MLHFTSVACNYQCSLISLSNLVCFLIITSFYLALYVFGGTLEFAVHTDNHNIFTVGDKMSVSTPDLLHVSWPYVHLLTWNYWNYYCLVKFSADYRTSTWPFLHISKPVKLLIVKPCLFKDIIWQNMNRHKWDQARLRAFRSICFPCVLLTFRSNNSDFITELSLNTPIVLKCKYK